MNIHSLNHRRLSVKRFYIFTAFLFSLAFFLTACSKKDANPAPEEIWVPIVLGNDTTLTIESVNSPLSAISKNEDVATARIEGSKVLISTQRLGSTDIMIRDNKNIERIILKIEVGRGYTVQKIESYLTSVLATDPEIRKSIEAELNTIIPLPVNAVYGFNATIEPSSLYIFPEGLDKQRIEGTIAYNRENRTVTLKYSEKEFTYVVVSAGSLKSSAVSESPITQIGFIEDFTEKYQNQYPQAGISRAFRVQVLGRVN